MQDLFNKWAELQKPVQGVQTFGATQQRFLDKIQVLESLLAAGHSQIPGEPIDVRDLLEDLKTGTAAESGPLQADLISSGCRYGRDI